jgi:hypothetical protein
MVTVYLGLNALMYLVLGLWCAIAPQQTSTFVGLKPISPGGQSEYMAVYGGLEFGLGAYFAWAVVVPEYRRAALLLALLFYLGIVVFRTFAVIHLGFGQLGNARGFYVAEILLLLSAVALTVFAPASTK